MEFKICGCDYTNDDCRIGVSDRFHMIEHGIECTNASEECYLTVPDLSEYEEYAHDIPEKDIQAVINGVMHHPELMDDPDFRAIVLANDKEIRHRGMTDFLSPGEIPHYDKAVALIRKIE